MGLQAIGSVAALDTGSTALGSAAVANGAVIYQAEVTLRNDITGKLEQRRSYRRTRRGRQTRYWPARFDNRSASSRKGRLPPSMRSKVDSHLREVRFIESILPVSQWKFELSRRSNMDAQRPGRTTMTVPLSPFLSAVNGEVSRSKA